MLRRIVDRIRRAGARRGRGSEHHVLGAADGGPAPAAVKLPRHPDQLLRTDSWGRLSQLTDQRIRAHRGDRLTLGEMVETVSREVEDAVATQPIAVSLDQWRTWAAATETPWPAGFHELLVGGRVSEADEVEAVVHVQSDLTALMPQVVVARLSENRR